MSGFGDVVCSGQLEGASSAPGRMLDWQRGLRSGTECLPTSYTSMAVRFDFRDRYTRRIFECPIVGQADANKAESVAETGRSPSRSRSQ